MKPNWTYKIDPQKRVATVRFHGAVTAAELASVLETVFVDPAWSRDFNIMMVYERTARMGDLDLSELQKFQHRARERQDTIQQSRKIRSAIVYEREEHKIMLELYIHSAKDYSLLEEKIFGDELAAQAWLSSETAGEPEA